MSTQEELQRKANELLEKAKNITSGLDFNLLRKSSAFPTASKKQSQSNKIKPSSTTASRAKPNRNVNSTSRQNNPQRPSNDHFDSSPPSKRTKPLSFQELMKQAKSIDSKEFGLLSSRKGEESSLSNQVQKEKTYSQEQGKLSQSKRNHPITSRGSSPYPTQYLNNQYPEHRQKSVVHGVSSLNSTGVSSSSSPRLNSIMPSNMVKNNLKSSFSKKSKLPTGLIALNQNKRDLSSIEEQQEEIFAKRGISMDNTMKEREKRRDSRDRSKESSLGTMRPPLSKDKSSYPDQRSPKIKSKSTSNTTSVNSKTSASKLHKQSYNQTKRNSEQNKKRTLPEHSSSRRHDSLDDSEDSEDSEQEYLRKKKQAMKNKKEQKSRYSESSSNDDYQSRKRRKESDLYDEDYVNANYSSIIQKMFGYNRNRYQDDSDVSDMEADYNSMRREEARSARIAKLEDEREEELERKLKLKKSKKIPQK